MSECEPLTDEELDRLACRGQGCKLGQFCKDRDEGRCTLNDVLFELERFRKALPPEAMALDAARYRWLREKSLGQFEHPIVVSQKRVEHGMQYVGPLCLEALDKAIDSAMGSNMNISPIAPHKEQK